jgi:hypothetical protein
MSIQAAKNWSADHTLVSFHSDMFFAILFGVFLAQP